MIYHQKYLPIKILFQNLQSASVKGLFRPQAYIEGGNSYNTECQMDFIPNEIRQGEQDVVNAVLVFPVGFGEHLRTGIMLTLKDGIDVVGKAIILEINLSA